MFALGSLADLLDLNTLDAAGASELDDPFEAALGLIHEGMQDTVFDDDGGRGLSRLHLFQGLGSATCKSREDARSGSPSLRLLSCFYIAQ